jgi:hypothetical protein
MLSRLRDLLAYEPAILAWAANGGVAAILGLVTHASPATLGAVTTVTTALVAVYTACRARPVAVSVLMGAAATLVNASAAFGLHLAATQLVTVTTVLSAVLGLMFRANLTPATRLAARNVARAAYREKTLHRGM